MRIVVAAVMVVVAVVTVAVIVGAIAAIARLVASARAVNSAAPPVVQTITIRVEVEARIVTLAPLVTIM